MLKWVLVPGRFHFVVLFQQKQKFKVQFSFIKVTLTSQSDQFLKLFETFRDLKFRLFDFKLLKTETMKPVSSFHAKLS